jgi:5-methylcytosine-specific restriction endonuclease McrA
VTRSVGRTVGLRDLAVEIRHAASRFEADRWTGEDCARLAEELARAAKACDAAAARAAARAVECHAGDVEWLARTTGATPSRARDALSTTAALRDCPATSEAVADGSVSLAQAKEIVAAAAVAPGAELELLEVAASTGLGGLRAASRKVRLGAVDREELHERQWGARSVRHWIDREGMVAGHFRLPPRIGVPFVNRLDAEADRLYRAACREQRHEPHEAHAADALVKLLSGKGKGWNERADVVLVCSLDAYRRGHTHGDELCHVIGGGPVPVSVVREAVAHDAFVKAVVLRGVEIHTVAHFGRRVPAEVRTALDLGPAPAFEGAVCVEEGCDRRYGLERDHQDPVANGGPTSFENLKPRCRPCHRDKTERDRAAGLLGGGRAPPDPA